jgi:hypothetical protein
LPGDLNGDRVVDFKDIRLFIYYTVGVAWLAPPVSLVKNGGMNKGAWGTIPPNPPIYIPGIDSNDPCAVTDWPKYWYLWNDTAQPLEAYVLHIDNADPTNLTKPCVRLDLDAQTIGRNDGAICQVIDVCDYNGQDLLVSFMHKGNITAPEDTVFEYRPAVDGCSSNWTAGPPVIERIQRGGSPSCGDCYGALNWDWEPYTHIMTVNTAQLDDHGQNCRYLHLHFRLCGEAEPNPDPEQYLKIDTVTVVPVGSTIPVGDITLDGVGEKAFAVDFYDFAIMAGNWLKTQQSIP